MDDLVVPLFQETSISQCSSPKALQGFHQALFCFQQLAPECRSCSQATAAQPGRQANTGDIRGPQRLRWKAMAGLGVVILYIYIYWESSSIDWGYIDVFFGSLNDHWDYDND